jgi:hypothetical protein
MVYIIDTVQDAEIILNKYVSATSPQVGFFRDLQSTQWSIAVLDKLAVAKLVKKSLSFMEPEGSLSCSQETATGPYTERDESNVHPPNPFP